MPCPECLSDQLWHGSRIGNRRGDCRLCNAWASAVRRETNNRLRDNHPQEWQTTMRAVEVEKFRELAQNYLDSHPGIEELLATISDGWPPVDMVEIERAERALDERDAALDDDAWLEAAAHG